MWEMKARNNLENSKWLVDFVGWLIDWNGKFYVFFFFYVPYFIGFLGKKFSHFKFYDILWFFL